MFGLLRRFPLSILFFAFIAVVAVIDIAEPDREFSELENTKLRQAPSFSFGSVFDNVFQDAYVKYISDQFTGRDAWIDMKSRSEQVLGKQENNGVIYGAHGYMFGKYMSFDGERLDRNVEYIGEFLRMYEDVPATVMIVPSSYMALKDKLPQGTGNVDQGGLMRGIYSKLGAYAQTVDLLPALYAHGDEYIYYRTDHHWTALGAYYAYLEYAASKGMKTVERSELSYFKVPDFYGTLFSKSKRSDATPDVITIYDIPVDEVLVGSQRKEGLNNLDQLKERDKYAALLHSNNGLTVIKSRNNLNKAQGKTTRALVVKDSFANTMAPYLTYCYDELYIVDPRYFGTLIKMSEIMAEHEFDEILVMYGFENLAGDSDVPKLRY